jgi:hypothetical protein
MPRVWIFSNKFLLKRLFHAEIVFFDLLLYLVKQLDMGYNTKVQVIKRAKSEQYYVNFPAAVAQAIEFTAGEEVEWLIDDHQNLVLRRSDAAVEAIKKKLKKKST